MNPLNFDRCFEKFQAFGVRKRLKNTRNQRESNKQALHTPRKEKTSRSYKRFCTSDGGLGYWLCLTLVSGGTFIYLL